MKPNLQKLLLISFFVFPTLLKAQQEILWADRVLQSNPRFEYENNHVGHSLGLPSLYQGMMYGNLDLHTDGYILYNQDVLKKNGFIVGFPKTIMAQQIIIGGVLNMGSIFSISAITPRGKEVEIYQMMKGSVTKFHNFYTFFHPMEISAIKIVIDQKKVRDWNLIKGIGITNMDLPLELMPDIYVDDEFHGKEKVDLHPEKNDCHTFNHKLSHDGKIVYFVKECPGQTDQDIWYAELSPEGKWLHPKKADFPLNNDGHNFVAAIGSEGNFLLLGNTYKADGSNEGDGVSISHKKPDGTWEVPQSISITGFKNMNYHANFFMSNDERVLVMAIEDDKSIGDLDLYASFLDTVTKKWSHPLNLGPTVNTNFTEDYPYLSNDGKSLYFSSTGYIGFGGHDLYVTHRLDDTWTKWSKPLNLGPLVNSKSDDHGFYIENSGTQAFFNTSNYEYDTTGKLYIHRINLPKALRQDEKVTLSGKVISVKDSSALEALIQIKKDGNVVESTTSNPNTGQFAISVLAGKDYNLVAEKEHYFIKEGLIELSKTKDVSDIPFNIALQPFPDSGQSFIIKNIVFVKGSSELNVRSFNTLDSIIKNLKLMSNVNFEVGVHTDSKGDQIKNKALTTKRANSISKYLILKGVAQESFSFKGYGSDKPIADNGTDAGRILNRRVTITYLTNYHPKKKIKRLGIKAP